MRRRRGEGWRSGGVLEEGGEIRKIEIKRIRERDVCLSPLPFLLFLVYIFIYFTDVFT